MFPVSLVKPYHQTGEDTFASSNKGHTPQDIVEVEGSYGPLKSIGLNGKENKQYLVSFKNQTPDKGKWFAEHAIADGDLHLEIFRASRRLKSIINYEPLLEGGYVSL
ncbi:hypothetical protein O181_009820 [Austropuccinia psidii MF-1]|uniref:Uncharacterized protein n=1 Tax=Austropuccinia psidii MF-1 TaxID=1389203 RepID=A0A9Q3BS03_9BASI|nr:hypothetical protein [Austropuccinia psidii MF-1]